MERQPGSFRLDARELDHLCPFFRFSRDISAELRGGEFMGMVGHTESDRAQNGTVCWRLAARDSGPELPPGALEHLQPFYTTKSTGMGLGLSICRSIIEAHGGRLWGTANVPRGATFRFTVPVNPNP
jgi:signal transduction histidine kinase